MSKLEKTIIWICFVSLVIAHVHMATRFPYEVFSLWRDRHYEVVDHVNRSSVSIEETEKNILELYDGLDAYVNARIDMLEELHRIQDIKK